MKVEIKKLPKSEVEVTVHVPYEQYMKAEQRAMQNLGEKMKLPGFRPGHVPADMVRAQVDAETLESAILEAALPDSYAAAVKEHELQVIAPPKVDIKERVKKEGDTLVYVARVAVMPEVKMGDYRKIKVKRPDVKVTAKEVDEAIAMVMERFTTWTDVQRAAKKTDRAELTFEGFDKDGKAIANTASKNHPVILGSGTLVPGFEDSVEGMKPGETKDFDVTFPKTYHAESLQGVKVKFTVTLNRLEEKHTPPLDDALATKIMNEKKSVEDFKKIVEEDLLREMKARSEQEHDGKVIQELLKITSMEMPDILIEEEIDYMKQEQKRRVEEQGLQWDQYLKHIKKSEEDFAKDHRKGAEERIVARLGVQFILKDAPVTVSDDDVDARVSEMLAAYPEDERKKARANFTKDTPAYRNLKNNMAADKLIEMLSA